MTEIGDEDEELAWNKADEKVESLLEKFMSVRTEQIALLQNFDGPAWISTREAVWGSVALLWVVSKTYQHTTEHINDVMRIGLFWDFFTNRNA